MRSIEDVLERIAVGHSRSPDTMKPAEVSVWTVVKDLALHIQKLEGEEPKRPRLFELSCDNPLYPSESGAAYIARLETLQQREER